MSARVTFLMRASVISEAQSFHEEYPMGGVSPRPLGSASAGDTTRAHHQGAKVLMVEF